MQESSRSPVSRDELAAYARSVGVAAAATARWYVSIIWKGSTYKPWDGPYDFFPGLSDLDIHVYHPGRTVEPFTLRRLIQDQIGPPPADTQLQLLVLDPAQLPEWWTVLPGTYHVLAGGPPPVPIPDHDLLVKRDLIGLAEADAHADQVEAGIISKADGELWAYLRSLRWMFPPVLYRAATAAGHQPEKVWTMNRTEILDLADQTPELELVRMLAIRYFDAALGACGSGGAPLETEQALAAGVQLLRGAAMWAGSLPEARVERRTPNWPAR